MKTRYKGIIIFALFLLLFTLGQYISQNGITFNHFKAEPKLNSVTVNVIKVSETINSGEDTTKVYISKEVVEGKTALDLLQKTTKIQTKGEGKNAFITEINGRHADDSKREFWAFYVNGKQAEVGAGSYVIKNNDEIEWKIETY